MLELKNITKSFMHQAKAFTAVNNVSLKVDKGCIYGIIGKSGAGKSTLLRCINLLEIPDQGQVLFEGQNLLTLNKNQLRSARQNIGMIFQHFNLVSHSTVFDNIAMPLRFAHKNTLEIKKSVAQMLEVVNLSHKAQAYPHQLSGGEKQRVAIARALVTHPKLLLCDEATSALDPETTVSILQLLKKINQNFGLSIVLITHEMAVIKDLCDKVAVIENGQLIEENDTVSLFAHPKTQTAKNFVNSVLLKPLPEFLKLKLAEETQREHSQIVRLVFLHHASTEHFLSHLIKTYDLTLSVLQANTEVVGGDTLGTVVVKVENYQKDWPKVLEDLAKNKIHHEVLEQC